MTESTRSRLALSDVQVLWPKAVIYKFNDRATKGIPDAVVAHDRHSMWLEFKDGDEPVETLMNTARGKIQRRELRRLMVAGHAALIVVFRTDGTWFYDPVSLNDVGHGMSLAEFLREYYR